MKKKLVNFLVFILSVTTTFAQDIKRVLTYGTTTDHTYSNEYFGMSLTFDKNWSVKTKEDLQLLEKQGREIMDESKAFNMDAIDLSVKKTAFLFGISEYRSDDTLHFNASFYLMVENLGDDMTIKSGKDYLKHVVGMSKKLGDQYVVEKGFSKMNDFTVAKIKTNSNGIMISQWYLSKVIDRNVIAAVVTTFDKEQEKQMTELIKSIKFN